MSGMKPSLQVRLSQHLALTPQLQQSIRLLQLSTLELQQEVEQMLEQNPFLEAEEETVPTFDAVTSPAAERTATTERDNDGGEASLTGGDEAPGVDSEAFGTTEREDWENGTERDDFDGIRETPSAAGSASGTDNDDFDPQDRNQVGQTLQEFLRDQLPGMRLSPEDLAALHVLIESLDDDGYLADPLEDIAALLVPDDDEAREDLIERLQCALKWLQSMEPTGVGARSLSECLTLQLRLLERSEAQMIAIIVCKQHLDLLARRDLKKLMAATGADESLLKEAQQIIVSLEPKPARRFARAEANIIVPDVIVQKSGRNWKVVLNPDVMPKLRINDL